MRKLFWLSKTSPQSPQTWCASYGDLLTKQDWQRRDDKGYKGNGSNPDVPEEHLWIQSRVLGGIEDRGYEETRCAYELARL